MHTIHPYYFSSQKRFFDLTLAVGLLTLMWPVFIIISLVIFITSGWPIFFFQPRASINKKSFKMIKFRTMYVGAHNHQHRFQTLNKAPAPMFKIFDDPRFVGIGRFLSRTGLDELPQLINILLGEMSFVGPRPLPMTEARQLKSNWNFRFQVKPGVFSEWTFDSGRHESLSKWRKLDEKTLSKGNWYYDALIILKTLRKNILQKIFPFFFT